MNKIMCLGVGALLLCAPVFAAQPLFDSPEQEARFHAIRIARLNSYSTQISAYINEARSTLGTTNLAGQEFVVNGLLPEEPGDFPLTYKKGDYLPRYDSIGDFLPLPYGMESPEWRNCKERIASIQDGFIQNNVRERQLPDGTIIPSVKRIAITANGHQTFPSANSEYLSYPNDGTGNYAEIILGAPPVAQVPNQRYHGYTWMYLAAQSPYPLDKNEAGQYVRIGQDEAKRYLYALQMRNQAVVSAIDAYLQNVAAASQQRLRYNKATDTDQETYNHKLELAKALARYAFGLTEKIHRTRIKNIAKTAERQVDFYILYAGFANQMYAAWATALGRGYQFSDVNGISIVSYSIAKRTGWFEIEAQQTINSELYDKAWNPASGCYYLWNRYPTKNTQLRRIFTLAGTDLFILPDGASTINGTRRGRYNTTAITNYFTAVITAAYKDTPLCDRALLNRFIAAYADRYVWANQLYTGMLTNRASLTLRLDGLLKKYADYYHVGRYCKPVQERTVIAPETNLPVAFNHYALASALVADLRVEPNPGADCTVKNNNPPVPAARAYPSEILGAVKTTGFRITREAGKEEPDAEDVGKLTLRWVITGMPQTPEAKSRQFVLYQDITKLVNSAGWLFQPDVTGTWQVTLFAADHVTAAASRADIKADTQRILWIEHKNAAFDPTAGIGIDLELFQPDSTTKPLGYAWGGPFYREAAHLRAGVYKNFDDRDRAVDADTAYVAPEFSDPNTIINGKPRTYNRCFSLNASGGQYLGMYAASDCTTEAFSQHTLAGGQETLTLYGTARGKDARAILEVIVETAGTVTTPLTCLILPGENGAPAKQTGLRGTFKVEHCVDYLSWEKGPDGTFQPVPGKNGVVDWMERRATEMLNQKPDLLPFVDAVKELSEEDTIKSPNTVGRYVKRGKNVYFNKYHGHNRYNLLANSMYGFSTGACMDNTVLHEGYHAFYWWTVENDAFGEMDAVSDHFPDPALLKDPASLEKTRGRFNYTLDSNANRFGGMGPQKTAPALPTLASSFCTALEFKGDAVPDSNEKWFITPPITISRDLTEIGTSVPVFIPANLPTASLEVEEAFLVAETTNGKPLGIVLAGSPELARNNTTDFFCLRLDDKTLHSTQPKAQLLLTNKAAWEKLLRQQIYSKLSATQPLQLYVRYIVRPPAHSYFNYEDYDACLFEGGTYTGNWTVLKEEKK